MRMLLAACFALAACAVALAAPPKAPPLSGRDALTGKRVSLADYRGHPVLIPVWSSW